MTFFSFGQQRFAVAGWSGQDLTLPLPLPLKNKKGSEEDFFTKDDETMRRGG